MPDGRTKLNPSGTQWRNSLHYIVLIMTFHMKKIHSVGRVFLSSELRRPQSRGAQPLALNIIAPIQKG